MFFVSLYARGPKSDFKKFQTQFSRKLSKPHQHFIEPFDAYESILSIPAILDNLIFQKYPNPNFYPCIEGRISYSFETRLA